MLENSVSSSNSEAIQRCNYAGCIVLDPWFSRPEMALIVMMVWASSEAGRASTFNGLLPSREGKASKI